MEQNKNLEYYLNSKVYSEKEVQESIEKTKKEFPNKNVKVDVKLNDFGMYIITFTFENKERFIYKIIIKIWKKFKKTLMLENSNNKKSRYDKYKNINAKMYHPF